MARQLHSKRLKRTVKAGQNRPLKAEPKRAPIPERLPLRAVQPSTFALHRAMAVLMLGAGILVALVTVIFVLELENPLPFFDHWVVILHAAAKRRFDLRFFWWQHSEHRILIPKLFFVADLLWNRGRMTFVFRSVLFLQFGTVLLWVMFTRGLARVSAAASAAIAGLALVCSYSLAQADIFFWSFEVTFAVFVLFVTFCLGAFSMFYKGLNEGGRPSALWFSLCIAGVICASLSLASGLVLWPILVFLCMVLRLPRRITAGIAGIAAAFVALWFVGYRVLALPGHVSAFAVIRRPFVFLSYLALYFGGPLFAMGLIAAGVLGGAGLLAASVLVVTALREKKVAPFMVFPAALMCFWVAGAGLTALGRLAFGISQAADSRYQAFTLQFWLALAVAAAYRFRSSRRGTVAVYGALILCALLSICPYLWLPRTLEPFLVRGLNMQNGSAGLMSGVTDYDALHYSHPGSFVLQPGLPYLRDRGLASWAEREAGWMYEPLKKIARGVVSEACAGSIDGQSFIESLDSPGFKLHGRAWDPAPRDLVLVDEQGKVVGIGRGQQRATIGSVLAVLKTGTDWTAYVGGSLAGKTVTVYALANGAACAIGSTELVSPWGKMPRPLPLVQKLQVLRPGVFRNGDWYVEPFQMVPIRRAGAQVFHFGQRGDIPVVGDWDGSGRLRIGVFRQGHWLLDMNGDNKWDGPGIDKETVFGKPGDIPVTGDWDGSGRLRIGVFRKGWWYLDLNGNGVWDGPKVDRLVLYGQEGDYPVVGDWDLSGRLHIGVFRKGTWFVDANGDFASGKGNRQFVFGVDGDIPVMANWDGIGPVRVGVFRHGTLVANMNGARYGGPEQNAEMPFGIAGDWPIVGPW